MRPYLGWKESEKARERDRKLIGEEMYQDIMILNECDRAAHMLFAFQRIMMQEN